MLADGLFTLSTDFLIFVQTLSSSMAQKDVNPIQTGGGGILPAQTLDVYNFFIKQAKPTKLGDFP